MERDTIFEMATASIRFGAGATAEIGMDLTDMGVRRVLLVTDPRLREMKPVQTVLDSLERESLEVEVFDRVSVEPTDASFMEVTATAQGGSFDGFVGVGGGSSLDTAKVANLYSTYPADLLHYVNAPIGGGNPVPGPLKPLIAVPTTSGTGSETTGVAIFDLVKMHAKTGIAHRHLKPTLGIIDPDNTRTLPPAVTASTGLDVLTHAVESYTAIAFDQRPRPERPTLRPAYQGANPISDLWAIQAMRMVATYLERAVRDPQDDEARGRMLMAASFAGIGFGNAGVHLPHGMSYPVSGMVESFVPPGYAVDHPMVPHGMAVVLNAPAAFRFTAPASPQRHLNAAEALGADIAGASQDDAGAILADTIIGYLQRLGMPNGLSGVGYGSEHVPALVAGTLPQHRVTKLSPRPVGEEGLARLFEDALSYW